jgi:hypothetical protein
MCISYVKGTHVIFIDYVEGNSNIVSIFADIMSFNVMCNMLECLSVKFSIQHLRNDVTFW